WSHLGVDPSEAPTRDKVRSRSTRANGGEVASAAPTWRP
ncbi:MAG: hypothetical protein AVDCRST_MAG49-3147, partial [uncultured Thermomicrobiales bacterium]